MEIIKYILFTECFNHSFDSSSRHKFWGIFERIVWKFFFEEKEGATKVATMPQAKTVHLQPDCNDGKTDNFRATLFSKHHNLN